MADSLSVQFDAAPHIEKARLQSLLDLQVPWNRATSLRVAKRLAFELGSSKQVWEHLESAAGASGGLVAILTSILAETSGEGGFEHFQHMGPILREAKDGCSTRLTRTLQR